jgi:hypothetical protein
MFALKNRLRVNTSAIAIGLAGLSFYGGVIGAQAQTTSAPKSAQTPPQQTATQQTPANKMQAQPIPSQTPTGVFGFMDDSTVLTKGVFNPKYLLNPSSGGQSQTWEQKLTLNYGFASNFQAGIAISYVPTYNSNNNPDNKITSVVIPLQYVFVQRMQNGTGFALVTTLSMGRETITRQPNETQWEIDNHFVLDHDFDGRYFIGTNIGYTASNNYNALVNDPSGTFYLQVGGTIKLNPYLYWGVQLQLSQQLNSYFTKPEGWASFIGTSIAMPLTPHFTIAASYMRQMIGGIDAIPQARLNTQDFSQNMGRLVLSVTF